MGRVVLLTSTGLGLPALSALAGRGLLVGVAVPARDGAAEREACVQAKRAGVPSISVARPDLATRLPAWCAASGAEALLVACFPWRIPREVEPSLPSGAWNLHFGRLPEHRGPDAVFWEMCAGDRVGALSVHRLSDEFDAGPLWAVEDLPSLAGETRGMRYARLSVLAASLAVRFAEAVGGGRALALRPQDATRARYEPRPGPRDLAVRWRDHDAAAVARLADACNPSLAGAMTSIGGAPLRIVAATALDGPAAPEPGTIVRADRADGLVVASARGTLLRLDVVETPEGVFSGARLVALGVRAGTRFDA